MSKHAIFMALISLFWLLPIIQPLSAASAAADGLSLEAIVLDYDALKPKVMGLVTDIRGARKAGQVIESGKILLVRKDVSELIKALRRYDKDHLRAAKGARTYPDREKILRLFNVADAIHRLLEAETKAADFQMLGYKYEEMWKQADAARARNQSDQADHTGDR